MDGNKCKLQTSNSIYSSTDYCTISVNAYKTSVQMRLVWINGVQKRDKSYMAVFYKRSLFCISIYNVYAI